MKPERYALLDVFTTEARTLLGSLAELNLELKKSKSLNKNLYSRLFALVHSIKGAAGIFKANELYDYSEKFEEFLLLEGLDKIENNPRIFGSFVNSSLTLESLMEHFTFAISEIINKQPAEFERNTDVYGECSIDFLIKYLDCVVDNTSTKLNKKVDFIVLGKPFELHTSIVQVLSSSLLHLIQNSIDHGIENSEHRLLIGKPSEGKVVLKFEILRTGLNVEFHDDGAGINLDAIKSLLVERKLKSLSEVHSMSEAELINSIFVLGLTTKKYLEGISGRGLGMYRVKSMIEAANGSINAHSVKGKGASFKISLPFDIRQTG